MRDHIGQKCTIRGSGVVNLPVSSFEEKNFELSTDLILSHVKGFVFSKGALAEENSYVNKIFG